jgi:hypothetical protein
MSESGTDVIRCGRDQRPHLIDGGGAISTGGAINVRIASTWPSRPFEPPVALPDWAARAALTASSGSDFPCRRRAERSDRLTSTTLTPAACRCRARPAPYEPVPSIPTRSTLPSDQPRQQRLAAGPCCGGRLDTQQAADLIKRGSHVDVQMGVDTAGHSAFLYDGGHGHPFLG